jgi:hypothetical protein
MATGSQVQVNDLTREVVWLDNLHVTISLAAKNCIVIELKEGIDNACRFQVFHPLEVTKLRRFGCIYLEYVEIVSGTPSKQLLADK